MKTLLIMLLVMLIPAVVVADPIGSEGCFVDNTANCSSSVITCRILAGENIAYFGDAVGNLCDRMVAGLADRMTLSEQVAELTSTLDRAVLAFVESQKNVFDLKRKIRSIKRRLK